MAKKEEKTKKENSKNKKRFFKDFKAELKKVSWPTPKQLVKNTIAVVTIVLITAAIVFVLDLVFETLNEHGVEKIKEVITTNNTTEEGATTDDTTTEDAATENVTEETTTIENTESEAVTTEENTEASSAESNTENNAE